MSGRHAGLSLVIAGAAFAFPIVSPSASPTRVAPTFTVRVDARDFSFKLTRLSVPVGSKVRFVVRNRGATVHDFVVNHRRTRRLRPGQSQTIVVTFPRRKSFTFLCSVPGHAQLGMKGTFAVGKPPAPQPAPPPPAAVADTVELTKIGTFDQPVLVTAPPGDARLFVVEQTGTVRIVLNGEVLPRPFLDLRQQVTDRGESGLLSIAFAPDYERSGLLYAFYNAREGPYGDIHISEFRRADDPDVVDPSTERVLLTVPKPYENHNGGMLQFGPDGYLYASVGDGDPGALHPAGYFAQRLDSLLGSILRVDPRGGEPYAIPPGNPFLGTAGARPEIWAYGLRNPWRFWIDNASRQMIIADVGSTSREELDLVRLDEPGLDFGWPCFEGSVVFNAEARCDRPVAPLIDWPHQNDDCAVIGGVVVHDARIPSLAGRFLYGDLCAGAISSLALEDGRVTASTELGLAVPQLTSFGVDALGRVYVMSLTGDVFRLDPREPAPAT